MPDIDDLIARLEAAEHGSRELDAVVFEAVLGKLYSADPDQWEIGPYAIWGNAHGPRPIPNLTTSLDAITSLFGEKLTGGYARVQWCGVSAEAWVAPDLNSPDCPQIYKDDEERWHDYYECNECELRPGSRDAAILAFCIAFLRAWRDAK